MHAFVQHWFGPKPAPIGIDLGADTLRAVQVSAADAGAAVVAAASIDVPPHCRTDVPNRIAFFASSIRDILAQAPFRGRNVVLNLPASWTHLVHAKLKKIDDESLRKALPWELHGKLPFDPAAAVLRHSIAGETYADHDPRLEVIAMAARRDWVEMYLEAATSARLNVTAMAAEPLALLGCFSRLHRRKGDADSVNAYVDLGCTGTRVYIAQGSTLLFARQMPLGTELLHRRASETMKLTPEIAAMRVDALIDQPTDAPAADATTAEAPLLAVVEEFSAKVVAELDGCRRYLEHTFAGRSVEKLIFVGGGASLAGIWQRIARGMQLPAQVGDPIAKLARNSDAGPEMGIDRRSPQPGWAVAAALSLSGAPQMSIARN